MQINGSCDRRGELAIQTVRGHDATSQASSHDDAVEINLRFASSVYLIRTEDQEKETYWYPAFWALGLTTTTLALIDRFANLANIYRSLESQTLWQPYRHNKAAPPEP